MPTVSVIIPTYNRAKILRGTLESMMRLDLDGLSVEFVVIDNNSSDATKEVIESFVDKLPVHYLFEEKPGKSRALNRALDEVNLGEIVVFTDDDIIPQKHWLKAIVSICNRWPAHSVFGGKVDLIWPNGEIPGWAQQQAIWYWAFGHHDQGNCDYPYPLGKYPGGAHYWIRREVLTSKKRRFDDSVGPEQDKPMGDETTFLHKLASDGYPSFYSHRAVISHRVEPKLFVKKNIRKRAYRWGRGMPHSRICHPELFEKHLLLWRLLRIASLIRHVLAYAGTMLFVSRNRRIGKSLAVITRLGYDIETLKISFGNSRES